MEIAFSVPGTWAQRGFSMNDIEEIKKAKNPKEIESTWGMIQDWFCGSQKEKAKKALYEFINNSNPEIRIDAFNQLKHMASPAYKDAFSYTVTGINELSFTVNLSIAGLISTGEISTKGKTIDMGNNITSLLSECSQYRNINLAQLELDIPRSHVYLDDNAKGPKRITLENMRDIINTDKMTEEQIASLDVALSQTAMIDICEQIYQNTKDIPIRFSPKTESFLLLEDSKKITINIHFYKNVDENEFSSYKTMHPELKYRCLYAKACIEIDRDGKNSIPYITVSHPGIE